ncbi:hypothetical protein [Bradyrhizobium sp. USDA 4473]
MKAYRHGAQGAERLSSSQLIPDSRSIAGQGVKNVPELSGGSPILASGAGMNRRALMSTLASAAAVAATVPAAAMAQASTLGTEPIFGMIERHKRMAAALNLLGAEEDALCDSIRKDRRRSSIFGAELELCKTDDPRWISYQKRVIAEFSAVDELACEMLSTDLGSVAAVVALLRYGLEHVEAGNLWPDNLYDGDARRPWLHFAVQNAMAALEDLQ